MQTHPSERELELFMIGELSSKAAPSIVRHLVAGCSECGEATSRLWEVLVTGRQAPKPAPEEYEAAFDRAWLRATEAYDHLRKEREAARMRCKELLALPPRQRQLRVRNDRRFQTLALCEALIADSQRLIFDDAATASHLAEVAREITEHLDANRYGEAIVADIRADAWATCANSARETSDFESAENALQTARAHLEQGTGSPVEKAKYLTSLANLLTARGQVDDSLAVLEELQAIYSRLGDSHMLGRAQLKEAFALHKKRDFDREIPLLYRALELLDPVRDPMRQLIALHNLVVALIDAGRPEEADLHMAKLRRLHSERSDRLNLLRFRWLEGRLAYAKGELDQAVKLSGKARNTFIELDIGIDVALISLDLAEALWLRGSVPEARERLAEASPILRALVVHTEALAALAFLEHAVCVDTASAELICRTAAFIRQVRSNPSLCFRPDEITTRQTASA